MEFPKVPIHGEELEMVDLWSRPGLWARQRAYIFLFVNVCVYGALNVFVFWIQNCRLFDFSWESYTATYHKTLIDLVISPMNVEEVPALIPIIGMLLAVIIIVPILISQLYGFRFSVIFAAEVLLLGHLPVLSLFLLACSFIAGSSRHWLPFKFSVAILSLVPIAVYFYVATRGSPVLQLKSIDPTLLYAPWVLAFLAAAVIAAAVLAFAKVVKYRPGGILISMIPFFAIPGILFHLYIGADQLEFRLLVERHWPERQPRFPPTDISELVFQEARKRWLRFKVRDLGTIVDIARVEFTNVAQHLTQEQRVEIITACEAFERTYPRSRWVPNELYIQALAEDLRFDARVLVEEWRVAYHTDLVSPRSRPLWRRLIEEYPDSVYAQPARMRLAIILARNGQIGPARKLLQTLIREIPRLLDLQQTQPAPPPGLARMFAGARRLEIPRVDLTNLLQQARTVLELIEHNGDDPKFGSRPLAELLMLDRHHPKWSTNLLDLAVKYPDSKLHDNLLVLFAHSEADPRVQKALLQRYAEQFQGRDAGALALYELAKITWELALVDLDEQANQEARKLYQQLIDTYPQYSLIKPAEEELARINRFGSFTGK